MLHCLGREAPRIHYPVTLDHCTDPGYPLLTVDRKTQKRSHWLLFLLICISSAIALTNQISTLAYRVDPNVLCWYTHNRDPSSIRDPHQEKYGSDLGTRDLQHRGSEIETKKLQKTPPNTCCPQLRTREDIDILNLGKEGAQHHRGGAIEASPKPTEESQPETEKDQHRKRKESGALPKSTERMHRTQVNLHYIEQASNQIRREAETGARAPDPGAKIPQFRRKKETGAWAPDLGVKTSQFRREEETGAWAPDRSAKTSNPGARASDPGVRAADWDKLYQQLQKPQKEEEYVTKNGLWTRARTSRP